MDSIVRFQPKDRAAVIELDNQVHKSVRLAIIRSYQDLGTTNTYLDIGTLAGLRALTPPHNLAQITQKVVKSLNAEGFHALWDKSSLHSPSLYSVYVDWGNALKSARNAERKATTGLEM